MSKSVNHWYPRYPADYAKKTRHLSLLEHGAYALLMDYCYSTGNPLPANAVQLHRICMALDEHEQAACMSVVEQFFVMRDGWLYNERIDEELLKRSEISKKRSKAAGSRYAKAPAKAYANAPANADTSTATATVKKERAKALLSSDADDLKLAFDLYNEAAARSGLPQAQTMNEQRKSAIRRRLKEAGGIEGWKIALEKVEASPHCTGQNDRGWKADLDFILQPKSFTRLMEGSYDRSKPTHHQQQFNLAQGRQDGIDPALTNIARIVGLGAASGDGRG